MILRTLELDGRIERSTLRASTLRRFYAEQGLDRVAFRSASSDGAAAPPMASRPSRRPLAGRRVPMALRSSSTTSPCRCGSHALLDDASRYVVAIEARYQEREVDMLAVLIRALRRFGAPDAMYFDNGGATYRGETLSLACARLGTALVHAKPYDAPARGKMERFWRTLREQCLVFCKDMKSLHDLNVRILAWLDEHYHQAPHGGLMGQGSRGTSSLRQRPRPTSSMSRSFDARSPCASGGARAPRQHPRDGWRRLGDEPPLPRGPSRHPVARSLVDADDPPWIEHEDKVYPLSPR